MHAPTQDKSDEMDILYEEPEYLFDQPPKFHMKILLGYFNAEVGEKIFSNQQSGTGAYM